MSINNFKEFIPHLEKSECPTKKRIPVYNFLRRTLNHETSNKDGVKRRMMNYIHDYFIESELKKIRTLTLPGITWDFEKSMRKRFGMFREHRIRVITFGCENDYKVFRISASKMPCKGNDQSKLNPYYSDTIGYYVCNNMREQVYLLNIDIFDYLSLPNWNAEKLLNFIWFDTTHTVITIANRLKY